METRYPWPFEKRIGGPTRVRAVVAALTMRSVLVIIVTFARLPRTKATSLRARGRGAAMKPGRVRVILAVMATTLVGAEQAFGETFVVDAANPQIECQNPDFPSINAAVQAADAGDRVKVCPGLYTEQVLVDRPLILEGPGHGLPGGQCLDEGASDPTRYAVVGGVPLPFQLLASNITLAGFTVRGTPGSGVSTSPLFSGYEIRQNVIEDNGNHGLLLHSSGVLETRATQNCIRRQASSGIFSQLGASNIRVSENFFTAQGAASISFVGGLFTGVRVQQEDILITHNDAVDGGQIVVIFATGTEVSHNLLQPRLPGLFGAFFRNGIRLNANINVDVHHNRIEGALGDGILDDVGPIFGIPTGPNIGVRITHNRISAGQGHGISLRASVGHIVEYNLVQGAALDGISLRSAIGNIVRFNESDLNGSDGIHADSASGDNTIERNRMDGNAEHDCHDDSVGLGSGGSANFWLHNHGDTENRPGLCMPTGKG
jgi:Periplasmic copper-binding protein (NosD)